MKTILHYRIKEKLGQGGMGVVYLAEDTRLKRKVAIKFLPQAVAINTEARERFKIEAQAAAALNHPNIAHIYAIEETDDELFIVMEYIEGKELKEIIHTPLSPPLRGDLDESPLEGLSSHQTGGAQRAGDALPIETVLSIATQIAEGLQAAHEKGIVHRDIKSANIMITENGKVKIMDFGLAKVGQGIQLTKEQSTLGTAPYMSPEQARGDEVDQRTDIWSYGILLYEMFSGKMPFSGDYEAAILYSILHDQPGPVSDLLPDASEGITNLIDKCLEKEKERRYQSVSDILPDLKRVQADMSQKATGTVSISRETVQQDESRLHTDVTPKSRNKSRNQLVLVGIALLILVVVVGSFIYFSNSSSRDIPVEKKMLVVLPFENLGNTDDEYFADGITGEITSKLSGLSGLGVIARSSAMQYKNSQKSLQQIAAELGVQYILEGTVQWEQGLDGVKRVRVNPELIEIDNATQIWSKPYEANFSSVFDLQANIAATVAEALNLTLLKSEKKVLEQKITENSAAYDLYLRAVSFAEDITNEKNSRIAEKLFLDAVALDENFAAAYAGLSTVQSNMYWEYTERTQENLNNSKANALKALAIDPALPVAHVAMGDYHYHGKLNYESALLEYNQALKLQPDNVDANNGIGFVYRRQGKMREAISYFKKTFKLDPRNFTTVYSVGETYILLKEYDKGVEFLDKAISIAPDGSSPIFFKSKALLLKNGDISAARKLLLEAHKNKIGLDYPAINLQLFFLDLYERKFSNALSYLEGFEDFDWQFYYKPADLLKGLVFRYMNNENKAEKSFTSTANILLEKRKKHPDDSRLYTSLGLAYAGLGQKDKALLNGHKGLALLPMEREAWRGSYRLLDLAQIYVMVGENESALKEIEKLLSSPTDAMGIWLLKLDPVWDSLRDEPGYQKLLDKYADKNNDR